MENKQDFFYLFTKIGYSSDSAGTASTEYSQKINEFFTSSITNKKS